MLVGSISITSWPVWTRPEQWLNSPQSKFRQSILPALTASKQMPSFKEIPSLTTSGILLGGRVRDLIGRMYRSASFRSSFTKATSSGVNAGAVKGIFYCPTAVLKKIRARLGTKMLEYPIAAGTITFQAYDLGPDLGIGQRRTLVKGETFTTTVEQVAYAFVSPVNLPSMGVYETAIVAALNR